jgi:hypothetical protein
MDIELKVNDIVWSGKKGGSAGRPYYIKVNQTGHVQSAYSGCWCPKEAIDFLQSIGIRVNKSSTYSSGYSAAGCWFQGGEQEPLSPHVQEAYDVFSNRGNKFKAHVLERFELS